LQLKIGSVQNVETSTGLEGQHVMYATHQKLETWKKEPGLEEGLMKEGKLSITLMIQTMMNMTILGGRRKNFGKASK